MASESIDDGHEKRGMVDLIHETPELLKDLVEAFLQGGGNSGRVRKLSTDALFYGSDGRGRSSEVFGSFSESSDSSEETTDQAAIEARLRLTRPFDRRRY